MRKRSTFRRRRRGAAMVEFAMVLIPLLTIVLGIIDIGRTLTVDQILTNAAREGARSAALAGATDGGVQTIVDNYLTNSNITTGYTTTIAPTSTGAVSGTPITVTITMPVNKIFLLPDPLNLFGLKTLQNLTLAPQVTMRRE